MSDESLVPSGDQVHLERRRFLGLGGAAAVGLGAVGVLAGAQPAAAIERAGLNVMTDLSGIGGTNAVGDGSVDDSEAIQFALNVASLGGGMVLFPKGRYKVTRTMTVASGVHLLGEGSRKLSGGVTAGVSEVFASGYQGAVFTNSDHPNGNVHIRLTHLLVRGPGSTADFPAAISIIKDTGSSGGCAGIDIEDCAVYGGGLAAIDFQHVAGSSIRNCWVGGDGALRTGIHMFQSPDNHMINNQITTGQGVAGGVGGPGLKLDQSDHVVVDGNMIFHSDDNIWLGSVRCVISGNRIDSAWLDGVRVVGNAVGNVITGNVFYNHGRGGQSDQVGAHGVGLVEGAHHTVISGNSFGRWTGEAASPRYGVAIRGTSNNNSVVGNTFVDQTVGGVQLAGGANNVVTGNAGQA